MKFYLYYRTYWGDPNGPGWLGRNILAQSKMELIQVCIKSMELEKCDIYSYAFVDNSNAKYTEFISKKFNEVILTNEGKDISDNIGGWPIYGGTGSLMRLMEFMLQNNHKDDDVILLVEDDYLFLPGALEKWITAVQYFNGFVFPMDHPDRYIRNDDYYAKKTEIHIVSNHHWRQVEAATSVMGAKYKLFRKTFFLRKIPRLFFFGMYPGRLLGKELPGVDRVINRRAHYLMGINVYSPIPGIACHLSKFFPPPVKNLKPGMKLPETQLSYGVDWEARYKEMLATLQ